jgi:hypothetical protein
MRIGDTFRAFVHRAIDTVTRRLAPPPDPAVVASAKVDGYYLGAGAKPYPPSTSPDQIGGVKPASGEAPGGRLYYVNGIRTPVTRMPSDMQQVADATGCEVVGIYRATHGATRDIGELAGDWFERGGDPAADTLSKLMLEKLRSGEPMHMMGDSGGAATIARALKETSAQLAASGMPPDEVQKRLGLLSIDTIGGAQANWPDGPHYRHFANEADPTARFLGVLRPGAHPGRGAEIDKFNDGNLLSPGEADRDHSFGVYLPQVKKRELP